MSKITPWISQGSPCSSSIGNACSRTQRTVPSSWTIRYSWLSGRVAVVRLLVLVPRAFDVVGVHVVAPGVGVGEPLVGLDADQVADLRAHVDRRVVLVDRVEVDDRRDVLDERPVLRLGLELRVTARLQLGQVAEGDDQERLAGLDRADVDLDRELLAAVAAAQRLDASVRRERQHVGREQQLDRAAEELVAVEPGQELARGGSRRRSGRRHASRPGTPGSPPATSQARSRAVTRANGPPSPRAGLRSPQCHACSLPSCVSDASAGIGPDLSDRPEPRSGACGPACAPPSPTGSRTRSAGRGTGRARTPPGPRTPAPDQAPFASSSSATTGLIAVCHTTACAWSRPHVSSLSTTWYR